MGQARRAWSSLEKRKVKGGGVSGRGTKDLVILNDNDRIRDIQWLVLTKAPPLSEGVDADDDDDDDGLISPESIRGLCLT